jgi:CheY-like chemotaxis protein
MAFIKHYACEKKILYVDDEEINLRLFKKHLSHDYVIFTAVSAAQGVEILKTTPVDLVITISVCPISLVLSF